MRTELQDPPLDAAGVNVRGRTPAEIAKVAERIIEIIKKNATPEDYRLARSIPGSWAAEANDRWTDALAYRIREFSVDRCCCQRCKFFGWRLPIFHNTGSAPLRA